MEKKFINLDNLKILWINISKIFARQVYVESLEKRIILLEESIKKLTS